MRGGIMNRSGADPIGWDPLATTASKTNTNITMVLEGLTMLVQGGNKSPGDLEVVPLLAERWEQTNDTTYTFYLQKGVKFKDNLMGKNPEVNREMTAEDVVWSFKRASDPLTGSRETKWKLGPVKDLIAVDKYTVKISLKEPYAPLLKYLTGNPFWIIPKEVVEKYGDMVKAESAVGTGPFQLEEYKPNVVVKYKRNPDYWQKGLPYLDGVNSPITFTEGTLAAFRTGKIDFLNIPATQLDTLKQSNPEAVIQERKSEGYQWIGFRTDQKPFNDIRVRRAIAMSIDYDGWIKSYLGGKGFRNIAVPAGFEKYYLPYEQWGDAQQWYQYNPQKAKELPNGFKVLMNTGGADYYGAAQAQYWEVMKKWLSDIGIDADIKAKLYTAYASSTWLGDYDGMAGPQTTHFYFEPNDFSFYYFYPGMAGNVSHVDDPELNKMLLAQQRELDDTKRVKILQDVQKYIADKAYVLGLPSGYTYDANQPWIGDFRTKYGVCAGNYGAQYIRTFIDATKKPKASLQLGLGG
ncbi:MAG: ABC transporter substrate-binding protein [Chloroflexi bacterium]|nr:ABC transporter substrate-binding protein [Chloroflexota bacterium]